MVVKFSLSESLIELPNLLVTAYDGESEVITCQFESGKTPNEIMLLKKQDDGTWESVTSSDITVGYI